MSELLFIGNGFDLDLGLKTRYSDFALSEFWPFRLERPNLPSLAAYLNRKKELATWLDLECELGNYAGMNTTLPSPLPGDENAYKCLTERLAAYLAEAQTGPISNDSCAARVLKTYLTDLQESEDSFGDEAVYSFNYTDLHAIAGRLGLDTGFGCRHIHGNLKDGDIVLGFGDGIDCGEGCEYMRKSFNPRYNPPPAPQPPPAHRPPLEPAQHPPQGPHIPHIRPRRRPRHRGISLPRRPRTCRLETAYGGA